MNIPLRNRPILCNYYITYRCNASCSFCDIWEKPSPYVKIEEVEKNLKDMRKLGVRIIDFTGGEPLLHQQLGDFLALAKKYKMLTTITTNCLLYPKRAEELKGKVDMLHFSLDSIVEEKHNASRRVNCYQHVMESIDQALNLGEKPDILFTVTPQNIEELPEILNFCKSKNLVLIVNPIFNYQGINEQEDFTIEQLNELIKFGKEEGVFLNRAFIELRKNGGNDIKNPVCKAGSNTIVISPENKLITPCYHLGTKEFPIKSNLKDLFYSDKVEREKSKAGQLPACEGCTINCYMQPSFSTHLSKYFFYSLPSTLKYNRLKGTWKKFFRLS